jgi:hypothetical protein
VNKTRGILEYRSTRILVQEEFWQRFFGYQNEWADFEFFVENRFHRTQLWNTFVEKSGPKHLPFARRIFGPDFPNLVQRFLKIFGAHLVHERNQMLGA